MYTVPAGAVDASRLSYQQLLQAPGMPGAAGAGQLAGMAAASGAMQQLGPHGEMPASSAALVSRRPATLVVMGGNACDREP